MSEEIVKEAMSEEEAKIRALLSADNYQYHAATVLRAKEAHVRRVKNGFLVFGSPSFTPHYQPDEFYCATLEQVNEEISKLLS